MATGIAAVERFAADTGIPLTSVKHTARVMREADTALWPQSGKGGGKAARHVEAKHLANLILALAGPQPSDAPETIARLRLLVWTDRETVRAPTPTVTDSAAEKGK